MDSVRSPRVGTIAFRVCLYLTVNRGAALFTDDIRRIFGVDASLVAHRLAMACRDGWLVKNKIPGEKPFYSAGPALMEAI